jgi:hypothetical protein
MKSLGQIDISRFRQMKGRSLVKWLLDEALPTSTLGATKKRFDAGISTNSNFMGIHLIKLK